MNYMSTLLSCIVLTGLMTGCSSDNIENSSTDSHEPSRSVSFDAYLQRIAQGEGSRATHPTMSNGPIDSDRLETMGFGVFAQSTAATSWASYSTSTPYNFMWNQLVEYDPSLTGGVTKWKYTPLKYWPNDNSPADQQVPAATGSQEHSYVSFFAYAPYTDVVLPGSGFDVKDVDSDSDGHPDHDGIVAVSSNSTNVSDSYVYYRTSNEKPFGVDESVDLLWAAQRDRYKMDGSGYTSGHVDFLFKHALSKITIAVKSLVDRTATHESEGYPSVLDDNSRIFIESVSIHTPSYYSEGKLVLASTDDAPNWNYSGVAASKKFTSFDFQSSTSGNDEIAYALRWAAPNKPTARDDAEDALADFEAMQPGITSEARQLPAYYPVLMFPPTKEQRALSVDIKYHVLTYDPELTLNNPKFYSDVVNNISAAIDNASFQFEANKEYQVILSLGLTSMKFEVSVLDDSGEYILLGAVVKEWDVETREANVE